MPVVRLSGEIGGVTDENRKKRARLLYRLFYAGWDIYNGNGDQLVSLSNIQEKIVEADAFVFTAYPTLEDMFKAASVFVGYQTKDNDLTDKPTVIVNREDSWQIFLDLISHLKTMGTVGQDPEDYLQIVEKSKHAAKALEARLENVKNDGKRILEMPHQLGLDDDITTMPDYNICVFCSASIKKEPYLDDGYRLGQMLAKKGWGCVSGAGRTGIMGKVVAGAADAGGWAGGSNVPHIIELEGLPDKLHTLWSRPDIYSRMEVMIERSDGFIIMPGGVGTIQELLALIVLKSNNNPLAKDKPIIIVNRIDEETGKGFWDPLDELLNKFDATDMVTIVRNIDEAIESLS